MSLASSQAIPIFRCAEACPRCAADTRQVRTPRSQSSLVMAIFARRRPPLLPVMPVPRLGKCFFQPSLNAVSLFPALHSPIQRES